MYGLGRRFLEEIFVDRIRREVIISFNYFCFVGFREDDVVPHCFHHDEVSIEAGAGVLYSRAEKEAREIWSWSRLRVLSCLYARRKGVILLMKVSKKTLRDS